MKMKKLLSVVLASIMLIATLSACGPQQQMSEAAKVYVDSEETLTLKWLGYPGWEGTEEGTAPELALEEKFNVEIEPIFYGHGSFNDKKVLLLASNEAPDLIYQMDPANLFNDIEQDYIAEVPYETLKQYAPELTQYITDYIGSAWLYTRYDGKNWGLPTYNHGHLVGNNALWRKDWLDKFDLDVPETLDDMHEAFTKFSKEDPDGNGKNDTYGITTGNGIFNDTFTEIFGAYGINPYGWQEIDGEVVFGGLTDAAKEAIKTLATWYSEGLIHPDFYSPGIASNNLFASGVVGYTKAGYQDESSPSSVASMLKKNFPGAEIAYGFLPKGPNGDHGCFGYTAAFQSVSFSNNEGYEKKVPRMLKMFETMFTDKDFYTEVTIGKEGETWEATPADTKSENKWQFINGNEVSATARKNGYDPNAYSVTGTFATFAVDRDTWLETKSDAWRSWYNEYGDPEAFFPDLYCKTDIVPSAADYYSDLNTKQFSLILEIIIGKKSMDDYAEFEKAFESDGGTILLEEAKEIGAELDKVYEELGK